MLILRIRIVWYWCYLPCSLYQTCLVRDIGYNYISVVIDWFSKEVMFVPCTKEETTLSTAELFRDHIWCQHGLPSSVVSDHGSVFASNFLGKLYRLLGVEHKMSTTFHPQTNGQTEWLNHKINQYLWTYINDHQNKWAKWIKISVRRSSPRTAKRPRTRPDQTDLGPDCSPGPGPNFSEVIKDQSWTGL